MGFLEIATDILEKGLDDDTKGGSPLINIAVQMISNPDSGGLQGLMKLFSESGLDDQVASWIKTGLNLPISSDQIMSVLGGDQMVQIANQLGVSENSAAGGLADILPKVIDNLTPDGQMPEQDLLEQGFDLLKDKLFS